jgi:hypothetical protein
MWFWSGPSHDAPLRLQCITSDCQHLDLLDNPCSLLIKRGKDAVLGDSVTSTAGGNHVRAQIGATILPWADMISGCCPTPAVSADTTISVEDERPHIGPFLCFVVIQSLGWPWFFDGFRDVFSPEGVGQGVY